jgi:hypothetical protein
LKESLDLPHLLAHSHKQSAVLESFDRFYNFQDPLTDPRYSRPLKSSLKRLPNLASAKHRPHSIGSSELLLSDYLSSDDAADDDFDENRVMQKLREQGLS